MDKEIITQLIENGVVMAAIIVVAIVFLAICLGIGVAYFAKRTEDGSFALAKHSAKLQAKRNEYQLNETLQLKGAQSIEVPWKDSSGNS